MVKLARRSLAALVAGLALLLSAGALAETDAEKELREVRERIEEMQRSMRRETERRDALTGQLRNAEENVRDARGRLSELGAPAFRLPAYLVYPLERDASVFDVVLQIIRDVAAGS